MSKKPRLAVTICATKNYAYAMRSQARLVAANLAEWRGKGLIVISCDKSEELRQIAQYYAAIMPPGWEIVHAPEEGLGEYANYQQQAQLVIARLRTRAFTEARRWRADLCWSLDSDVLPPANAFECMQHMLSFDGGYYGVSTCSYPNESFLGGFGSEEHPIAEDFLPEERQLSPYLQALYKALNSIPPLSVSAFSASSAFKQHNHHRIRARLDRWAKAHPPKGNVFELNAKGYRRRGWMENAYPGIGKGSVVPTDWCGFGCTLLGKAALAHANFEGYQGQGTEDLWIVWKRWRQVGIRINCITHVVCDHVLNAKKESTGGQYVHIRAYHESKGEFQGHIRTEKVPWLYD